ncbi:exported hypothetical protein [Mesorhizobium plurifarium]|uniref:Uncharacterized protein n=1 Tax=Mesorhizobium plurifarium TaxID=69974 RepID=A0A090GC76_MESPL|nr:exported hypothetical protein [Mesorhizobium plurifarium]
MSRQPLAYLTVVLVSFVIVLLAFGQAIMLAWLSQRPEPAGTSIAATPLLAVLFDGLIALVVEIAAVVRWVRQQSHEHR